MEWLHDAACLMPVRGAGTSDFHKQNQHKVRHGQRNIQDCMMLYGSEMVWPSDGRVMNQLSWKRDPNCQRIVLLMILHNQSSNACPSKNKCIANNKVQVVVSNMDFQPMEQVDQPPETNSPIRFLFSDDWEHPNHLCESPWSASRWEGRLEPIQLNGTDGKRREEN